MLRLAALQDYLMRRRLVMAPESRGDDSLLYCKCWHMSYNTWAKYTPPPWSEAALYKWAQRKIGVVDKRKGNKDAKI